MANCEDDVTSLSTIVQCGVAAAVVIVTALTVKWWRSRSQSLQSFLTKDVPKDTVVLHQFGKALTVPSVSPFVMKLETYLRVAKIPYINAYSRKMGPKGKSPWIQYNDQAIPDSQLCMDFLNHQRSVDLNSRLTPGQVAIGHLVRRTAEESLYWVLLVWRLLFETSGGLYKALGVPSVFVWYMRRSAAPGLCAHGIGRFTEEEVTQIMTQDLSAVSQILGEKRFLFGEEVVDVTEFDCALFGQLSQLVWQMPGTPVGGIIAEKFPNLVRFCEEMKTSFWPDWEERLLPSSASSTVEGAHETETTDLKAKKI